MSRLALACVLATLLPRAAGAEDPDPPRPDEGAAPAEAQAPPQPAAAPAPAPAPAPPPRVVPAREIVVEVPGERTRNNKLLVGGLLAAGVIGSGLGVYWHLDSRDAANGVSSDAFTGEAWTQHHVDLVERASRSKTRATIAYSIGGAFLIGAIVTYIVTAPADETAVIRTGVGVAPTGDGGTVVTGMWSF